MNPLKKNIQFTQIIQDNNCRTFSISKCVSESLFFVSEKKGYVLACPDISDFIINAAMWLTLNKQDLEIRNGFLAYRILCEALVKIVVHIGVRSILFSQAKRAFDPQWVTCVNNQKGKTVQSAGCPMTTQQATGASECDPFHNSKHLIFKLLKKYLNLLKKSPYDLDLH